MGKFEELLDFINELNENGRIPYDDYSRLFDLAYELGEAENALGAVSYTHLATAAQHSGVFSLSIAHGAAVPSTSARKTASARPAAPRGRSKPSGTGAA